METGQHHAGHAVGEVVGKILKEHLSLVTSTGSVNAEVIALRPKRLIAQ